MQPQLPFPPSFADDSARASARQGPPAVAAAPLPQPSGPEPTNPPFDSPLVRASERLAQDTSSLRDPGALVPSTPRAPDGTLGPSEQRAPVFVRHPRARRYVLRVVPDGSVRVTIPRWGSKREAADFAARQQAWIARQQRRFEQERRERLVRDQVEGRREPASAEDVRRLRERAKRELPERLLELAAQHRLTVTRISIRNQRWRWGSCSRSGHICLNWRLVQMPPSVRDYVLIHELMHLKRMDHSPAFWKLVAAACPGHKEARAWLRTQGGVTS
jgi:predicted metal-dependent hydrolase